jgi:hypothetical protein
MGHQFHLFHAYTVFAGDGAALLDAVFEDGFAGFGGLFEVAGLVVIEEDDGVEIAVSGVEDVADGEAVGLGYGLDMAERGGDFGSGDYAVLNVVRGTDAAYGSEGVFAAFPEEVAFFGGFGDAEFAGFGDVADVLDLGELLFYCFFGAFEFD